MLLGTDSSLGIYDLQAETICRRNLPSCEGLFGTADGHALVCAGKTGELFSVSGERPKPQRIGRLQPFREARASLRASLVWLSLKLAPRSPNVVLRCDFRAKDPEVIALEFPFSFQRIEASEAGDKLFLVDERTLHVIAVGEDAAVAERTVSLADQGAIVAVSTTDPYAVAWQEDGKQSWLAGMDYAP